MIASQHELRNGGWEPPPLSLYIFGNAAAATTLDNIEAKIKNKNANLPTQTACLPAKDCQPQRKIQPATEKIVVRDKELFERGVGASVSTRARVGESQSTFGWQTCFPSPAGGTDAGIHVPLAEDRSRTWCLWK